MTMTTLDYVDVKSLMNGAVFYSILSSVIVLFFWFLRVIDRV